MRSRSTRRALAIWSAIALIAPLALAVIAGPAAATGEPGQPGTPVSFALQDAAGLRWAAPGDPGTPSLTHYRVEANNGGGWVAAPTDRATEGLAGGANHTCAMLDTGAVKCWGSNNLGQLGLGDTTNRGNSGAVGHEMGDLLPAVNLGTGRTAVSLTAGDTHTCALLDNGTVKCWGSNGQGQLGLENNVNRGDSGAVGHEMGDSLPAVNLGTGRTALAISAGANHTCALLDDHTVKCWGYNADAQLGLGNTVNRGDASIAGHQMGDNLPAVSLGTNRTAVAISAAGDTTCALLENGSMKCWGLNNQGQLGLGDTNTRGDTAGEMGNSLPTVDLGTGRTATAIATGMTHTCALLDNGTVKCWGRSFAGELGQGDTTNHGDSGAVGHGMGDSLPAIPLGTGRTATAITAGNNHTCALLDNATVKCWGRALSGQLGLENTTNHGDSGAVGHEMGSSLPAVNLGSGRTVIAITSANDQNCALLDNAAIKCWGFNGDGELGVSDNSNRGSSGGQMGDNLTAVNVGTSTSGAAPRSVVVRLAPDTYQLRVVAVNSAGESIPSSASGSISVTGPPTAPGAPTGVAGSPGDTQASVSWTAPASDGFSPITDYAVTVFDGSGGAATGVTGAITRLVGSATTNLVFTGLTNGTAYAFRAQAVNVIGTSVQSSLSSALTPRTVPDAPTAVGGTSGDGSVAVNWTAPASNGGSAVTDYQVSVFDGSGGGATGVSGATSRLVGSAATSYAFTGLTNTTAYTFEVAALNAAGTGAQSALSSAITPATFNVPAMLSNPGTAGYHVGFTVNKSVTLSALGSWCSDAVPADCNGPDGNTNFTTSPASLNQGVTAFALVGRIGTSGPWTVVGSGPTTLSGDGDLYLAMNDAAGSFGDNSGTLQVTVAALGGAAGSTAPVSTSITAGQDAVWSVPINNNSNVALTNVTATLHANANGTTPLSFNGSAMSGCAPGGGNSEVCNLSDIPANSTQDFTVFVLTAGLGNGAQIAGDITVSADGVNSASGTLGTVTVVSCGTACAIGVGTPGNAVASSTGPPTDAQPTKQVVVLPDNQPGAPPVVITLKSIAPGSSTSAADRQLCPTTGVKCSGQISVIAGNFTNYVSKAHPVQVQIIAKWDTKVPAGRMIMSKDTGGPPIQLPACVRKGGLYNTPCVQPEVVKGSAGAHNLTTTDTILFVGADPHVGRRASNTPDAPTAVTATAAKKSATLQWKSPIVTNGAITGYLVTPRIGKAAQRLVTFKGAGTKRTITGLVSGKIYTFTVAAKNLHGISYQSIATRAVKVK